MRIQIVGQDTKTFVEKVRRLGLQVVDEDPEVIIAYGGDGTLIGSERRYPGIPKLGVRRDKTCKKCPKHQDSVILKKLVAGELERTRLSKLSAQLEGTALLAVNDVIMRNADPRSAVRFVVHLNGQPASEEMIGDGLVICTSFGSSAYFRSITRTVLRTGIGVAFNNCTDPLHNLVVEESATLEVHLTRGPALVVADNDDSVHELKTGSTLSVSKAKKSAIVLSPDTLRCPDCRYVNAPRRRY